MAKEAAKIKAGETITGLPRPILERISGLSIAQIEELARDIGVSLITMRFSERELDRIIALPSERRAFYAVSMLTDRDGGAS